MDNYNSENQYELNQNNFVQEQQAQNQYDYNTQNMYTMPGYENSYADAMNYNKPKRKWLKWSLIIGIPSLSIITTVILIIVLVGSSYDIDNINELSKVCGEILNTKLVVKDNYYGSALGDGYFTKAEGNGGFSLDDTKSRIRVKVKWVKYINEKTAELLYAEEVNEYREEYIEGMQEACIGNWDSDYKKTEVYLGDVEKIEKVILITEDEYILYVSIEGNSTDVNRLSERFIDEID